MISRKKEREKKMIKLRLEGEELVLVFIVR